MDSPMAENVVLFAPRWLYSPPDGKHGLIVGSLEEEAVLRAQGWKDNPSEFGTITHPERPASAIPMGAMAPLQLSPDGQVPVELLVRMQGLMESMQHQSTQGRAEALAVQQAVATQDERLTQALTVMTARLEVLEAMGAAGEIKTDALAEMGTRLGTMETQVKDLVAALGGEQSHEQSARGPGRPRMER